MTEDREGNRGRERENGHHHHCPPHAPDLSEIHAGRVDAKRSETRGAISRAAGTFVPSVKKTFNGAFGW
jgi:hypothetical protein